MKKKSTLGFDGASPKLINEWIDQLPVLGTFKKKKLMKLQMRWTFIGQKDIGPKDIDLNSTWQDISNLSTNYTRDKILDESEVFSLIFAFRFCTL